MGNGQVDSGDDFPLPQENPLNNSQKELDKLRNEIIADLTPYFKRVNQFALHILEKAPNDNVRQAIIREIKNGSPRIFAPTDGGFHTLVGLKDDDPWIMQMRKDRDKIIGSKFSDDFFASIQEKVTSYNDLARKLNTQQIKSPSYEYAFSWLKATESEKLFTDIYQLPRIGFNPGSAFLFNPKNEGYKPLDTFTYMATHHAFQSFYQSAQGFDHHRSRNLNHEMLASARQFVRDWLIHLQFPIKQIDACHFEHMDLKQLYQFQQDLKTHVLDKMKTGEKKEDLLDSLLLQSLKSFKDHLDKVILESETYLELLESDKDVKKDDDKDPKDTEILLVRTLIFFAKAKIKEINEKPLAFFTKEGIVQYIKKQEDEICSTINQIKECNPSPKPKSLLSLFLEKIYSILRITTEYSQKNKLYSKKDKLTTNFGSKLVYYGNQSGKKGEDSGQDNRRPRSGPSAS